MGNLAMLGKGGLCLLAALCLASVANTVRLDDNGEILTLGAGRSEKMLRGARKQAAKGGKRAIYRAFLDQPEFPPRYDPDNIHREVASRAEKFVPRAGRGPRDATETAQLDSSERKKGPSDFEVMATQKQMEKEVAAEEEKERLGDAKREAVMRLKLQQEETRIENQKRKREGKSEKSTQVKVVISPAEENIIKNNVKTVVDNVNSVADNAINAALQYSKKGPQPYADHRRLTVTANQIASKVVGKLKTAEVTALNIVEDAKKQALKITQDATTQASRIVHAAKAQHNMANQTANKTVTNPTSNSPREAAQHLDLSMNFEEASLLSDDLELL